jgi:uncharacterized membrane protein YeaQ/YmgE (transglycosylase-associated protein family)
MVMGIIGWIVFGFIIGLIARAIVPGRQNMGFIATTILGIVGSVLGGLVASALGGSGDLTEWHTAGMIGSLIGAIVVLLVAGGMFTRRRATV